MSSEESQPKIGSGSVGRLARWLPAAWRPVRAFPDGEPAFQADAFAEDAPRATSASADPVGPSVAALDPAYRRDPARSGENTQLWFRTDRVFHSDGAWYFATREGINVGPYENRVDARRDAKGLIRLLAQNPPHDVQAATLTIQQFMERPKFRHGN